MRNFPAVVSYLLNYKLPVPPLPRISAAFVPILLFLLFQVVYPHSFRVIQGDASYYHLLRAVEFSRYGYHALTRSPDVQAQHGGEPGIYPPLVHISCSILIHWLGIERGYEASTSLMMIILIASLCLFAYAAWGPQSAVLSGLLFFFITSKDWWLTILNSLTYTIGFAIFAATAIVKKRPFFLTVLLIILFYSHLCSCFIIPALFIGNLVTHGKDRRMLLPFVLATLLFLPYLAFFLMQVNAISGPDHRFYVWPVNDWIKMTLNAALFMLGAFVVRKQKDRPGASLVILIIGLLIYCVIYRWNHIPHVLPIGTSLLAAKLVAAAFERLRYRFWYILTTGVLIVMFLNPSLIPVPSEHLEYMLPWQYRNLSGLGARAQFISEYQRLAMILNSRLQNDPTVRIDGELKDVNGMICFMPLQVEGGGIKRTERIAADQAADTIITFSPDRVLVEDVLQPRLVLSRFGGEFSDWIGNSVPK